MSVAYYTDVNQTIPATLIDFGVLPTIRHFIHTLLFPGESPPSFSLDPDDYPKFIRSDIDANSAFEEAQEFLNMQNYILPFTAYAVGDFIEDEEKKNHNTKSYHYFSSQFNCFMSRRPMQIEIPLISFFSTANDYYTAMSLLHEANMSQTKLYAPININGVDTQIPLNLGFEISKGTYALEFEGQLDAGNIYDIVHTVIVDFFDINIDTGNIYPIETMDVDIYEFKEDINNSTFEETRSAFPQPEVTDSLPLNAAIDVAIDTSIQFTFSKPMVEDSVVSKLVLEPYFDNYITWNDESLIMTIHPINDLDNETIYTITVNNRSYDGDLVELDQDYILIFTTVVI